MQEKLFSENVNAFVPVFKGTEVTARVMLYHQEVHPF